MTAIEILTNELKGLKALYLQKTETWAREKWGRMLEFQAEYRAMKSSYKKTSLEKKYMETTRNIQCGQKAWEAKQIEKAGAHFSDSLAKLADRLKNANIEMEGAEIKTAMVGVNITTTIKCQDGRTVTAYTIMAEGPIQKPHYRYLVKVK